MIIHAINSAQQFSTAIEPTVGNGKTEVKETLTLDRHWLAWQKQGQNRDCVACWFLISFTI
jgi:hypothetical protein